MVFTTPNKAKRATQSNDGGARYVDGSTFRPSSLATALGYSPSLLSFSPTPEPIGRRATFAPAMAYDSRQVSPRHTFVPLRGQKKQHSSDWDAPPKRLFPMNDTPPVSPIDLMKASPTPSVLTVTTIDSLESSWTTVGSDRSPSTSPSGKESLPYIPMTHQQSAANQVPRLQGRGVSSLQRALGVPPRSIAVCQVINGSSGNQQTRSQGAPSPVNRKGLFTPVRDDKSRPGSSPVNRKALFSPVRDESDPVRKSKLKTELCLHYINKSQCPFGANCTYAHGEEELQLTKLMDLHEAGLVDVATYRTMPCLTYVSTGSCPFGKRCHGIHDPRTSGTTQSWLPHTETQGNTIATDINVDALHQKRLFSILHNNPFGELFDLDSDTFDNLYGLMCNTASSSFQTVTNHRKKKATIEEHHKLSIALQMRGGSNFQFKFRPQHIIYDELCMVLQKRAFRLTRNEAVEIPISMFNSRSTNNVLVREIAFGPDCDSSVRGVGLWFGINESDVTLCTPQQAKRYRWKRSPNKKSKKNDAARTTLSKFDITESFSMIRPPERDAYGLSTAILDHRLAVLKADRIPDVYERAIRLDSLEQKRAFLVETFDGLVKSWKTWAWHKKAGRATIDETTPVPSVDGEYKMTGDDGESPIARLWGSFVSLGFDNPSEVEADDFTIPTKEDLESENSRLSAFKHLAQGSSLPCEDEDSNTSLPHISDTNDGFEETGSVTLQSRRCWKSLLLRRDHGSDEWSVVRAHFSQSRSRKVLNILQQQ